MRNITVDSHDGVFHGILVVGVSGNAQLSALVKKIKTVKGVKEVERI